MAKSIVDIIRENVRASLNTAQTARDQIMAECVEPLIAFEVEQAKTPLQKRIAELEAQIEKMKNESFDAMVRRIAKEVVADEVRENLTISEDTDPFSGRRDPRWTLQWGGTEI